MHVVGCRLVFSVGPREVRQFRMVERHYFKDKVHIRIQTCMRTDRFFICIAFCGYILEGGRVHYLYVP